MTKKTDELKKQLCELISWQKLTIPIHENHDHTSIICSGDVIAIHIVCQCSKPSGSTDDQVDQLIKVDSSKDVSLKSI